MRKQLQYLLYILLFVLAGQLSKEASAAPSDTRSSTEAFFQTGADPQNDSSCSFLIHTFFAPEIAGTISNDSNYKAPVQSTLQPGYGSCTRPFISSAKPYKSPDLHSDGVGYYVFSLGKIVI